MGCGASMESGQKSEGSYDFKKEHSKFDLIVEKKKETYVTYVYLSEEEEEEKGQFCNGYNLKTAMDQEQYIATETEEEMKLFSSIEDGVTSQYKKGYEHVPQQVPPISDCHDVSTYDEEVKIPSETVLRNREEGISSGPVGETLSLPFLPDSECQSITNLNRDFNEQFQSLNTETTNEKGKEEKRQTQQKELYSAFLKVAQLGSETIIKELGIEDSKKQLKPIDIGGKAGGEKFKLGNILFKYCNNSRGIYADEDVMLKAFANEIRAMNALIKCNLNILHTTFTCLVNLCGRGVIATCFAPISGENSLIYGSSDGGQSFIENEKAESTKQVIDMLEKVNDNYSLAPHLVNFRKKGGIRKVHACCDLEIHRGRDGRLYAVDLARLFPPTPPQRNLRGAFLAFHFRPEFLKLLKGKGIRLSSDAFSGFTKGVSDAKEQAKAVTDCWNKVYMPHVEGTCQELDEIELKESVSFGDGIHEWNTFLHERGINLRMSGFITVHCKNPKIKKLILKEMLKRTLKCEFRHRFRTLHEKVLGEEKKENNGEVTHPIDLRLLSLSALSIMKTALVSNPEVFKKRLMQLMGNKYCFCIKRSELEDVKSMDPSLLDEDKLLRNMIEELGIVNEENQKVEVTDLKNFQVFFSSEEGKDVYGRWNLTKALKVKLVKPPKLLSLNESRDYLMHILKAKEDLYGSDSDELLPTLWSIVKMYEIWREESPEQCFEEGEKTLMRILEMKPKSWLYQYDAGRFYSAFAKYEKELVHYKLALDCNPSDIEKASILDLIGRLYRNKWEYDEALKYFEECRNIRENTRGKQNPSYATSLINIGSVYNKKGEYDKALKLYEECREIYEITLGKQHLSYATTLNNIGLVCDNKGEYDKALKSYEECRQIYEITLGKQHPEYATTLNCIGGVYNSKGEYDKALKSYEECRQIREITLGKQHPSYATTLNNIGLAYMNKGEYDKALKSYEECRQIKEITLGKQHPSYGGTLFNIGGLNFYLNEMNKSLMYLKEAEVILRKLGPTHPLYQNCMAWIEDVEKKISN